MRLVRQDKVWLKVMAIELAADLRRTPSLFNYHVRQPICCFLRIWAIQMALLLLLLLLYVQFSARDYKRLQRREQPAPAILTPRPTPVTGRRTPGMKGN